MKSNDIIQSGSAMYRIIDIADTKAFVVDCKKKSMPKWLDMSSLQGYTFCSLDTGELQDTLSYVNRNILQPFPVPFWHH